MKLKKIASLALAGVMAVSMLAGCSVKGAGDTTTETTATPSVVTAVNEGQGVNNKVKITFTSSTVLEKAMKDILADNGDADVTNNLPYAIPTATGETYASDAWDSSDVSSLKNGEKQVLLYTGKVEALNSEAAAKMVANKVDEVVETLVDTTYDEDNAKVDYKYADFSYAGEVTMVSNTASNGVTTWYYAFTVTQTATVKTLSK